VNRLIDSNDDEQYQAPRDREITLGTTLILGIFFGIAVLCAVFFGFGYSLGSKHAAAATIAAEPSAAVNFGGAKPAAGSMAGTPDSRPQPASPSQTISVPISSNSDSEPSRPGGPQANPVDKPFVETGEPAEPAITKPAPHAAPASPVVAAPSAAPIPTPAIVPGGQFVVQVAAVSHQEDADLIASTLKRRGYSVVIRQEPQDKLMHVQVGPLATKKDADTIRQKLLADGFNAYIK